MAYDLATLQEKAIDSALDTATLREIAAHLGMNTRTLFTLRRENPEFKQAIDEAMFEASTIVLDDLKSIPYIEQDPAMARVKIDALRTWLEMRWPARYGRQVNVNVKVLDMRSALDKARERLAKSRQSQVIDMYPNKDNVYTDSQSVDTSPHVTQAVDRAILSGITLDDLL